MLMGYYVLHDTRITQGRGRVTTEKRNWHQTTTEATALRGHFIA